MYDDDTNLTYMGARYYPGSIGRFLSVDPIVKKLDRNNIYNKLYEKQYSQDPNFHALVKALKTEKKILNKDDMKELSLYYFLSDPQQLNSYSYVGNNPILYIDENGEVKWGQFITGSARSVAAVGGTAVFLYGVVQSGGITAAAFTTYVLPEAGVQLSYGINEIGFALQDKEYQAGDSAFVTIVDSLFGKDAADISETAQTSIDAIGAFHNPNPFNIIDFGLDLIDNINDNNNSNNNYNIDNKHEVLKQN